MEVREIVVIGGCIIMSTLLIINIIINLRKDFAYVIVHFDLGVISVTDDLALSEDIINLYFSPNNVFITEVDSVPYFNESGQHLKYFKVTGQDEDDEPFTDFILVTKLFYDELL